MFRACLIVAMLAPTLSAACEAQRTPEEDAAFQRVAACVATAMQELPAGADPASAANQIIDGVCDTTIRATANVTFASLQQQCGTQLSPQQQEEQIAQLKTSLKATFNE